MMMPKDFGQNFGEEKDMASDTQEKTPGVYVRAEDNELPHELDMLWSNSRTYHREERSPLISFMVGLILGSVLTAAVFMLFVMRPQVNTSENEITAPIVEDLNGGQTSTGTAPRQRETAVPASGTSPRSRTNAGAVQSSGATSYTVVNGDNLGRIAEKVYGSSDPKYIDKIQRANNMSSPDKLQIDQKLIIPPKDY